MVLAACDLSYTVSRSTPFGRATWSASDGRLGRRSSASRRLSQSQTSWRRVSGYIRQAGRIDHGTLIHKCSGRGIMAKTVNSVIDTLVQGGRVTIDLVGRKRWYQWQAGRMLPAVAEPAEVEPSRRTLLKPTSRNFVSRHACFE